MFCPALRRLYPPVRIFSLPDTAKTKTNKGRQSLREPHTRGRARRSRSQGQLPSSSYNSLQLPWRTYTSAGGRVWMSGAASQATRRAGSRSPPRATAFLIGARPCRGAARRHRPAKGAAPCVEIGEADRQPSSSSSSKLAFELAFPLSKKKNSTPTATGSRQAGGAHAGLCRQKERQLPPAFGNVSGRSTTCLSTGAAAGGAQLCPCQRQPNDPNESWQIDPVPPSP